MAMAQDGYRSMPDHQALNSYPEPKHSQLPLHPASAYPPIYYSDSDRQRYRDGSAGNRPRMDSAQYQRSREPIHDAVNSAVDKGETSNPLPPDVLNQITSQVTASVLQQLKATQPDNAVPFTNLGTPAPPPALNNEMTAASSVHSDSSPTLSHRNLYTPPSPRRSVDDTAMASSSSPTKSTYSAHGRHTPDDDRRPMSPAKQTGQHDEARGDKAERPKAPERKLTEITILEKIWGPLFEGNRTTARLGQFLRGLAIHLIEDYEPKFSLVITPEKMQKYYDDTKLSSEVYPWQIVFDDRTSSISRLYREVEAQHHLVQDQLDDRPAIPALTPMGFERWSTLMLLAYPEQEFERLQKAVLDMPICNFEDRKERFPKEISRRLFPKMADQQTRDKIERALLAHCNISPDRRAIDSEQASQQPQSSGSTKRADSTASTTFSTLLQPRPEYVPPGTTQGPNLGRDRQAYVNTPSEDAIDEEDLPTPQPIERERKPYSSQPGGGKTYEYINRPPTPPEFRNPDPPLTSASATAAKLGRSSSVASGTGRSQPPPINPSQYPRPTPQPGLENLSVPESAPPMRHRANSLLNHHPPPSHALRHRSPSANTKAANDYRRTTDDDLMMSSGPNAYSGGPYSSSPSGGDVMDDPRRQRELGGGSRHYPSDRQHESSRSGMYEVPMRDREARPRYSSNAGYGDSGRGQYGSEEDHLRSLAGRSHNGHDGQQYYR